MKSFIVKVIGVSAFFVLIGAIADQVGAKFKSDEKALDIIKKARLAIGGDAAIAQVRGLVIKGQTSQTLKTDGSERIEQGETEIALQLPDKMMKMIKIGNHDGVAGGDQLIDKQIDVVVTGEGDENKIVAGAKDGEFSTADGHKIIIRRTEGGEAKEANSGDVKVIVRKAEGGNAEWKTEDGDVREINTADGKKIVVRKAGEGNATFTTDDGKHIVMDRMHADEAHGAMRQNELLRTTLSLLLTAPEGMDVSYTFSGEGDVNGTSVNSVLATFGGASYKLYFDRFSNLPVAMSYNGHPAPVIVKFRRNGDVGADATQDTIFFNKKIEGPGDTVENFVRFTDYRSTNGVQLPYKWTTTIGGKVSEVFDVTSYDVNPANLADRFKREKVFVRTTKPVQN